MNKFIKGFCSLGLSAILMTGLVGCGEKTSANQAQKTENEKIQVEYWYGLGGKLQENMEKIISDFNASQDKYEVKGIAQEDYKATFKNLQAGIAAKKAPALAILKPDKAAVFNNKNVLQDIGEYISKDNDFKSDSYIKSFLELGKSNDKQYAFPAFGTTQVLYYNKQAFKDAGISMDSIKTWTELGEASKKLVKKDGDEIKFYGWEPMWGPDNLIDASLSNGGSILSEDGSKVLINSPEWIEAWDAFRGWIHDDKNMRIHSNGQGWEYWYSTVDDVMQDRSAGYTGSSGDQGDLDFKKLAACEQPAFKEGKESKPVAESRVFVIPSIVNEEAKQGAYEFIKYFTKAEVSAKWSIASGYISVNKESANVPEFKEFVAENPQAAVPTSQALHATKVFIDPTDGKIYDALKIAADKVEIENVPAKEALDEAQKVSQEELNKVLKK